MSKREIYIEHDDNVTTSGYLHFAQRASIDIVSDGHGSDTDWNINHDDEIIFVKALDRIVACMVFRYTKWNKTVYIATTYVIEQYRRMGIYTSMYERLKEIAIEKGAVVICSGLGINNEPIRAASKKVGRVEVGIICEERLDHKPKDKSSE